MQGTDNASVHGIVRFLHLVDRTVGELTVSVDELSSNGEPEFCPVPSLRVGDQSYQSWQEAEEREIDAGEVRLADLIKQPHRTSFDFPRRRRVEPVRGDGGKIVAVLVREQQPLQGAIEISAARVSENLFMLTAQVKNNVELEKGSSRDQALAQSLISAHTILGVENGEFVSLIDPPDHLRTEAAQCRNVGVWPVLVGDGAQRDTILASPIILYDYPQLAPESPGDLFDSTEIDEILTLRILTLTDEEKRAAAGVDDRVRHVLARTQSLARDQLSNLHGTMRGLRPVPQEHYHG
jgi:hydrogenase maturation protease